MAVLTSTGAVNLTTSTNWSPAQIPADGDDLVIGSATLTIDANRSLNSVTFNNTSSRMNSAVSCTCTAVTWNITGALSARLFTNSIGAGQTVTLYGKWVITANTTAGLFVVGNATGVLNLSTIGGVNSDILIESGVGATTIAIIATSANGTINTTGRILLENCTFNSTVVTSTGVLWNHTSTGNNTFGAFQLIDISAGGRIVWVGDILNHTRSIANAGTVNGLFSLSGSGTHTYTGAMSIGTVAGASDTVNCLFRTASLSGVINLIGKFVSTGRGYSLYTTVTGTGTINYKNQTVTIDSGEHMRFHIGSNTLDVSDLILDNSGQISVNAFGTGIITSTTSTTVNNQNPSAQAVFAGSTAFDSVLTITNTPPVFPPAESVEAGEVYGWVGTPITGTGLIISPAVLEEAVSDALETLTTEVNKIIKTGEAFTATGPNDDAKVVTFTRNE